MNQTELIVDPALFFQELGDLHDVKIKQITWDATLGRVMLYVNDLNANFDGLPEYPGKREASIVFGTVENVVLNCDALNGETQRIYELTMLKKGGSSKYELMLRISPSGRLSFDCEAVEIIDVP